MGLLHPDNRDYTTTAGGSAPMATGAMPAQTTAGNNFSGGNQQHHLGGVNPATHIPATQTTATGPAPNTAGPHRHDILNRLDPTVDSDLSKTADAHNNQHHGVSPAVAAGVGAVGGAGLAHHHNHHGAHGTHNTHGVHNNAAYNNGGLGTAGGVGGGGLGTAGGVDGGGLMGGGANRQQAVPMTNASMASGPAPNTAGPHQSDMANRLDPTVDSHTGLRK